MFWNKEMKLEVSNYSEYHIDAKMEGLGPNVTWRVTLIYGEAQAAERHKRW